MIIKIAGKMLFKYFKESYHASNKVLIQMINHKGVYMESLFDELVEMATHERLDNILNKDKGFLEVQEKASRAIKLFEELELTEQQQLVVDQMVSTYNEAGAYYGRRTYKQGVLDCVELLKNIGLL